MSHTRYRHLTDEEFLSMIEPRRSKSPVIDELARRLETEMDVEKITDYAESDDVLSMNCPVCEASYKHIRLVP